MGGELYPISQFCLGNVFSPKNDVFKKCYETRKNRKSRRKTMPVSLDFVEKCVASPTLAITAQPAGQAIPPGQNIRGENVANLWWLADWQIFNRAML